MSPGNFSYFLPRLAQHDVQFVLIGGGAAIAHGLARTTYDVDIVYLREIENLQRIVDALEGASPYYRGAPKGLPFSWDVQTLQDGLNFTLTTEQGDIDLLGEVAGGGTYEKLIQHSETFELFGNAVTVVTLSTLITLKRAAGRPKDFEALAELEALLEEREMQ
jgi:predicted nucleotidyltransferase